MNRYNTCHKSIHKDEFGNYYFDIFIHPRKFKITDHTEYIFNENDIVRFDLILYIGTRNWSNDELVFISIIK